MATWQHGTAWTPDLAVELADAIDARGAGSRECDKLRAAAKANSGILAQRAEAAYTAALSAVPADERDALVAAVRDILATAMGAATGSSFGARLALLRGQAGLSGAQLAEAAGMSREAVRLYEAGARRPTWDMVQQLAAALGVPTDTFRDPR